MTPDQRFLFVNIQHPGEDACSAIPMRSRAGPNVGRPRSATVAISRTNGAVVGT